MAFQRLREKLEAAAVVQKRRVATKLGKGVKRRRMGNNEIEKQKKANRKKVVDW